MGSSNSKYLTNDEIKILISSNPVLERFYKKVKIDTIIPHQSFPLLFNNFLETKILKRIILIVAENQDKLSKEEFDYIYSLFKTKNEEAKLNFILDFIFIKKPKMPIDKYIKKVKKYFPNSLVENLLLNLDLLSNPKITDNKEVRRKDVLSIILSSLRPKLSEIKFLANNYSMANRFSFQIEEEKNPEQGTKGREILVPANYIFECTCQKKSNNTQLLRKPSTKNLRSKDLIKLERIFKDYERVYGGIFPIKLFEKMLTELNIDPNIISMTANYLHKKTEKSFINFDLFHLGLTYLSGNPKDTKRPIFEGLFEIMSFPKNYIKKNNLAQLMSSLDEKEFFNKFMNKKGNVDKIEKELFYEITEEIKDDILENFEKIDYIPYAYFGIIPEKFEDKMGTLNAFLNNRTLDEYVKEKANEEDEFFCVDAEFWENLKEGLKEESSSENESEENEEKEEKDDIKKAKLKSLVIDTTKFANKSGKINSDAKYKKDYYIITKKLYELFNLWFGPGIGAEVSRKRIYLVNRQQDKNKDKAKNKKATGNEYYSDDEGTGYNVQMSSAEAKSILSKSNSPIVGIDPINHLPYEIEINPICLQFYLYSNLAKKGTIDDMKNYLKENINGKDNQFYLYSRKETLVNILKGLKDAVSCTLNDETARFWVYYPPNHYNFCDIHETLEKLNIPGTALLVLEIKNESGKWPSDEQGNGNDILNVTSNGLTPNNICVGLENLGNSCYLNSILQTFLNNIDLRNLVFNSEGAFLNLMAEKHDESTINTKRSRKESIKKATVRPVSLNIDQIQPGTPGSQGKALRGNTKRNSVKQRKVSIDHIKNVFNDKWIEFLTNSNNKNSNKKGQLFKEFIYLMADKYYGKSTKLVPQKFKDLCGEYNNDFNNNSQQDAHDFFSFLVDSLHEDTNLKQNTYKVSNSEVPDTTEEDLGNEYWANNFRNNVSIFHSLFLGQFKDTLKCSKCNYEKMSFDTFTSLPLPIPEGKTLILEIVLKRLPFTMKSYYDQIHHLNGMNISLRQSLKKIRCLASVHKLEELDSECSELVEEENGILNINNNLKAKTKVQKLSLQSTTYYREHKKNEMATTENLVSNALNTQIPVRIKLEINKKEKCKKIITMLKNMKDLDLEQKEEYTYFLITNNNNYVNEELPIDECFESGHVAFVYELLNYKGIQKFYGNTTTDNFTPLYLTKNIIPYMVKLDENSYKKQDSHRGLASLAKQNNKPEPIIIVNPDTTRNYEIIVPIVHRSKYSKSYPEYYLVQSTYEELDTFQDYILLTTKNTMKISDLYEFIWEKYSYFLGSPSKFENNLWWRNRELSKADKLLRMKSKSNANEPNVKLYTPPPSSLGDKSEELQNLRYNMAAPTPKNGELNIAQNNSNKNSNQNNHPNCRPFVLKMVNKFTKACAFCPWYNFCNGCILDPFSTTPLYCDYNQVLVVEWCRELVLNEIVESNLNLVLNSECALRYDTTTSENNGEEDKPEKLENCLDLFTVAEDIKDFTCEKCKVKTTFKKKCEIEKLPKYLVISLKRFKFTSLYSRKIESLVNFPIENLDLNKYVSKYPSNTTNSNIYDLFAVVNHIGTLEGGHYISIVKHNSKWYKYDDASVQEIKEDIQTKWVYLLIYKRKEESQLYFNYCGIIDTAYKIYINQQNFENEFNYEIDQRTGRVIKENKGSCRFYYGEPVSTKQGKGFILNIYKENDDYIVKVKLKKGICFIKLKDEPSLKETTKDFASFADAEIPEVKTDNKKCEKCIIF